MRRQVLVKNSCSAFSNLGVWTTGMMRSSLLGPCSRDRKPSRLKSYCPLQMFESRRISSICRYRGTGSKSSFMRRSL